VVSISQYAPAPNPMRLGVGVRFDLETQEFVTLSLHDLLGRRITVVADGRYEAGSHTVSFDAAGLNTGTYFLRLQAGGRQSTRRVSVIR
jgi:hypothetical protein